MTADPENILPIIYTYNTAWATDCQHEGPAECVIARGDIVYTYTTGENPWQRRDLCKKHYGEKYGE